MKKVMNIPYIRLLPMVVISILAFKIINQMGDVSRYINAFINILVPFFWAFAIAFIAHPLMSKIEKKFKVSRNISLIIVYTILFSLLIMVILFVLPSIVKSIKDIMENIPMYVSSIENFLKTNSIDVSQFKTFDAFKNFDYKNIDNTLKNLEKYFNVLSGVLTSVINVTSSIFKLLIGVIISIYLLKDREKFKLSFKKTIYAFLKKDFAEKIIQLGRESRDIFSSFFMGKLLDSLIIGTIAFVGFLIMGAPYATLLGLIIGITNMIPYFGPFIGAVPVVLLVIFQSPITALYAAIFILILQQFDGYILGPKILGDSVGVTPFWIILAIIIGGGLFGVLGMFLGVPTFAVLRVHYLKYIDKTLEYKGIKEIK
ncbi:AI-2E family transporter [Helicovermis profundi]|uniref:AI-2E family transporter n=1 Tax=Helicovermis profundi TaxID=3065157 RepID=A0AAU9EAZ5_9FIRM|nr:AI-2E family transporter [Clostridia bacterium S502]